MGSDSPVAMHIEQAVVLHCPGLNRPLQCAFDRDTSCPQTYIRVETKATPQTCRRRCACQCHVPFRGITPKWLQGAFGIAFANFTGIPLLNQRSCDIKNCVNGALGSGSVKFIYMFPTWLLRTGIEFAASWYSLSGVGGEWSLRVPRTIDNITILHRICFAMQHHTVPEIRHLMASHGIRAFDSFLSNPVQNLFDVRSGPRTVTSQYG
jgi:hypothetical protein